MKPAARLPLLLAPLLALAGCGGSLNGNPKAGIDVVYSVTPSRATVATGGVVDLQARVVEGFYTDLDVSVREGSSGGAVVKTPADDPSSPVSAPPTGATYTAPQSPGTYHVVVRFMSGAKVEATETATIVVDVAP